MVHGELLCAIFDDNTVLFLGNNFETKLPFVFFPSCYTRDIKITFSMS